MALRLIEKGFYEQDGVALAKALLGKLLIHETAGQDLILRITETEAYMGARDQASHSWGGRMTRRNQVMFGEGGQVYMFMIYGLHHCFNITANRPGAHEAVLIRAGEPVAGVEAMIHNRGRSGEPDPLRHLTDGPGKVAQAMALDQSHYGIDLTDPSARVYLADDGYPVGEDDIQADARVGIDYAGEDRDHPWRFYLKSSPHVSLTRQQHRSRRENRAKRAKRSNSTAREDDKR